MAHRVTTTWLGGAVFLLSTVGTTGQTRPPVTAFAGPFQEVTAPAQDGAAQPNLAVDRSGRVWLSWLQPRSSGGHAFQAAALGPRGFSAPTTIAEGTNFLANWADFPAMFVAADGRMAAHWLERGASRAAYGIRMKTSSDAGRTWSAPITPHRDDSAVEHGFVSFFDAGPAGIGLAWLDGREMAHKPSPGGHGGGGNMTLRTTTVKGTVLGEELVLDNRVCDCCQTAATRTSDGAIVAFRDRSAPPAGQPEIRDISVVRFAGGKWSTPVSVHADNWELTGCPVNGPAVASSGRSVVVAWFTEAGKVPRVQAAFSTDGGRTFAAPVRMETPAVTLGRVDVVMASADRALVSFLERTDTGGRLVVREIGRDGRLGDPVQVAEMARDRTSGFARMSVSQGRLVVAWTDLRPGAPTRVRVATAPIN